MRFLLTIVNFKKKNKPRNTTAIQIQWNAKRPLYHFCLKCRVRKVALLKKNCSVNTGMTSYNIWLAVFRKTKQNKTTTTTTKYQNRKRLLCNYITWCKPSGEFGKKLEVLSYINPHLQWTFELLQTPSWMFASGYAELQARAPVFSFFSWALK